MKLVARTRWEYYVANLAGILAILGLLTWLITRAITDTGIDFKSVFFWLSLLLLITLPFALISFFSSMKAVEAKATGLVISYVFQKHKNEVQFSEIAEVKSNKTSKETTQRPRTIRDSFRLILVDGRVFEFDRSQFSQYEQLRSVCIKNVRTSRSGVASSTERKRR